MPFIIRAKRLRSKNKLLDQGFGEAHFRSTSARQDRLRGFGDYVHLSTDARPPILGAKLSAGFPHFEIAIPAEHIEKLEFLICRFNIAKTRYLLGGKQPPAESPANGRYYEKFKVPVAKTSEEKIQLIELNKAKTAFEILVLHEVHLPAACEFRFFHQDDLDRAKKILSEMKQGSFSLPHKSDNAYSPLAKYRIATDEYIAKAIRDPSWYGNGLEFDRV